MEHVPLPAWCTPHTVSVREYLGEGGAGPLYGTARTVAAWAEDEQKVVVDSTGAEVVSASQVVVDLDEQIPPASLVTVWPGTPQAREAKVIVASRHHHATLPSFQTLSLT